MYARTRTRLAVSAVAASLIITAVAGAGTASAATELAGYQQVVAMSAFDSANKSSTATCPAGKKLVGTGGGIRRPGFLGFPPLVGGNAQVSVDSMLPNSTLTAVTVHGGEDQDGYAGIWAVRAVAICATASNVGLTRVEMQVPYSSVTKSATASCPAGKKLVGMGGGIRVPFLSSYLPGAFGQVVMDYIVPNTTLTGVSVRGSEDQDGYSGNWAVHADAICANAGAFGGVQRVGPASTPYDSLSPKSKAAACSGAQYSFGAGGVAGGLFGAGQGHMLLDDLTPSSWTAVNVHASEDQDGYPGNWSVSAYALCANGQIIPE